MKTKKHDTSWMVSVALMAAIVIVLANTPLGMIQLPIIKATTVHIPVIIGAILLRPVILMVKMRTEQICRSGFLIQRRRRAIWCSAKTVLFP